MTQVNRNAVRIVEITGKNRLTPTQKRFNSLIKKIEEQNLLLALWQETLQKIQQIVTGELEPHWQILCHHRNEFVLLLDSAYPNNALTKSERRKVRNMILDMAEDLLTSGAHEHLKPIYNKHSGSDFDSETAASAEDIKSLMNDVFGVNLGDDIDTGSADKFAATMQDHLLEMERAEQQRLQADNEAASRRKKTKKQLEKEAQCQQAEANTNASMRDIYRKLTAALHPDREQDADERKRKTSLMQEVNVAYTEKNILRLLQLQLKVEQIDQIAINGIAEERLKHYNTILQQQSEQLRQEISNIEFELLLQGDISRPMATTPQSALKQVKAEVREIKRDIATIQQELLDLQDIKRLKKWLANYDNRDEYMHDEFDESF